MKVIYATNPETDSAGFYDEKGNLITAWQEGDDLTFQLKRLFDVIGIEFGTAAMPEPDGDYPKKIKV